MQNLTGNVADVTDAGQVAALLSFTHGLLAGAPAATPGYAPAR